MYVIYTTEGRPKAPRFVNNVATEPRYVTDLYHGCEIVQNVCECCILIVISCEKHAKHKSHWSNFTTMVSIKPSTESMIKHYRSFGSG